MTLNLQHKPYVIDIFSIEKKDIHKGDIIQFMYSGDIRYALVLHPNWKQKLHALDINKVPRAVLLAMIPNIFKYTPQVLYETYISNSPTIRRTDSYRSYFQKDISNVNYVVYDIGFNLLHENSINILKNAILLTYDNNIVHASLYNTLDTLIRMRGNKLYIPTADVPSSIKQYVASIGLPQKYTLWNLEIPNNIKDDEQAIKTYRDIGFVNLVSKGGVFFVPDGEIVEKKALLGRAL